MSAIGDRNSNKGRKKRRYEEQSTGTADWASVDSATIHHAIEQVTATGAAIRFGYSRDGGAFAVGIVGDGDPYTVWAGSAEEAVEKLTKIAESFST